MQDIRTIPVEFPSVDGKSVIKGTIWLPEDSLALHPKGIVQIVHGMSEHHKRYNDFASFLASNGFVVCANDHIGHGLSAAPDSFGNMDAVNGEDHLVEDVNNLRNIVSSSLASNTPYFIFGHSMGSLITRVYLSRYGVGLAGAVLCGTAHEPIIVTGPGNALARLIAKVKGNSAHSELLHNLAVGAYSKAIEDAETPLDWLSVNKDNIQNNLNDELTGFMFTAGGYATLTALARDAARNKIVRKIPKNLPLLFIAGTQDPVGNMGRGVEKAVEQVKKAGIEEVDLILYEGMRHEILNEKENMQVYSDVLDWLVRHAG